MAIKVIRHGVKVFRAFCSVCGCEFEYEYEDIVKTYDIVKQVKCPDCGEWINHKEYKDITVPSYPEPSPINPLNPNVIWTTPNINDLYDCDKCPNKPDFKNGKIIIGDTPCSLCPKNKPYCSSKVDYTFSAAADGSKADTPFRVPDYDNKTKIEK